MTKTKIGSKKRGNHLSKVTSYRLHFSLFLALNVSHPLFSLHLKVNAPEWFPFSIQINWVLGLVFLISVNRSAHFLSLLSLSHCFFWSSLTHPMIIWYSFSAFELVHLSCSDGSLPSRNVCRPSPPRGMHVPKKVESARIFDRTANKNRELSLMPRNNHHNAIPVLLSSSCLCTLSSIPRFSFAPQYKFHSSVHFLPFPDPRRWFST